MPKVNNKESLPVIARASERQKKPKKLFDPSTSKRRRHTEYYSSNISEKEATGTQKKNCCHCKKFHSDKAETIVNCQGVCSVTIHLTCLQSICENFGEKEELTWKCDNCQSCSICKRGMLSGKPLLKCYICFIYYHSQCLDAVDRIETVKENRFRCLSCEEKEKPKSTDQEKEIRKSARNTRKNPKVFSKPARSKSVSEINNTINEEIDFHGFNHSDIRTSTESPPSNSMKRRHSQIDQDSLRMERWSLDDNVSSIDNDTSIPNVFEWSTNEVYEYFKIRFPMQAHVFEYEEIDGISLYFLEREDVIKRFKIKLGPAIKIYSHILELKKKIDDSKL